MRSQRCSQTRGSNIYMCVCVYIYIYIGCALRRKAGCPGCGHSAARKHGALGGIGGGIVTYPYVYIYVYVYMYMYIYVCVGWGGEGGESG